MALLAALLVDAAFGEPRRWHPVAGMGRALAWAGRWTDLPGRFMPFVVGAAFWIAGAALVSIAAWALQRAVLALPVWLAVPVLALLLKPLFAWRMLQDEVLAVDAALASGLDAGRARLGRIVSRDTAALDAVQVRESAIESLAENLNDSVVAPLLWFALFGLPGAALYRYANTADALWGFRTPRWEWAGKWAARADDVLSWLPARITAALLHPAGLARVAAEARRTPSPNGGWPMGAMALRLGVRLAKPGVYVLHDAGRPVQAGDVQQAVAYASKVPMAGAALALAAMISVAIMEAA